MVLILCSTCKVQQPHRDFSPDKATKTGRHTQCKTCRREVNRRWYNRYKRLQMCVCCGRIRGAGSGATLCKACLFDQRERMRGRRRNKRA